MPKLIKQGQFIENPWVVVEKGAQVCERFSLVHLSDWEAASQACKTCGLWLAAEDSLEQLPAGYKNIAVIAINFPAFMDGRGFSLARQLREQKDFQGELRAIGNFFQDQTLMMKRCGFDAFLVPDDADLNSYKATLGFFTEFYQAAVDEPRPLFRRR
jgi:uncharacterized protein (DUF934 family)